ncbi:hypothetical protein BRAS3843_520256 [Bradyrhizobium sp. STM 3843]|nr:hypothetical protein BRAS3843_520256 [Bradyrhizobium sp. STM 3843]
MWQLTPSILRMSGMVYSQRRKSISILMRPQKLGAQEQLVAEQDRRSIEESLTTPPRKMDVVAARAATTEEQLVRMRASSSRPVS